MGGVGLGTVFELTPAGTETQIYRFASNFDGANPFGALYRDNAGNLYGTTCCGGSNLIGSVFAITASGQEKLGLWFWLYRGDGNLPFSGMTGDRFANVYGTTNGGGASNAGTVFKVDSSGVETVLYSFTGGNDGEFQSQG
jgi:uncharacterized repeat protein (TIGR03803 family)